MKQLILQTANLSIGYRSRRQWRYVAKQLNLSLYSGELVALVGPNGIGKSTLLRTLAGMQRPLAGHVELLGDAIHILPPEERARRLSVVLTDRLDMGLMTGYDLVALGRYPYTGWAGRLMPEDEAVVNWAIRAVEAEHLAPRYLHELSDGERQKLMIARALAQEPALVILDEPTAYLDLPRRVEILRLLSTLAHTSNRTFLLSTHDLDLALKVADRLWLMGEKGAFYTGAPEDLVLNGVFDAVFSTTGVRFDMHTGAFDFSSEGGIEIAIIGDSPIALWTGRALKRRGFRPVHLKQVSAPITYIELLPDGWRLHANGETHLFQSIEDLLQGLEAICA